MQITQSQVRAAATVQESIKQATVHSERIETLTREQTQQAFDNDDAIQAVNNGFELTERPRQAESEASVKIVLTTTREDRVALETTSIVTDANENLQTHVSSLVSQTLSEASETSEFTIRRSRPSGSEDNTTDATFIQINTVQQTESNKHIQMTAEGHVATADGRTIGFMLEFEFERQTQREHIHSFVGDVDLIDPIAINIQGQQVALSDEVFEFDLNADGTLDTISKTESGTGYLVFDRNGNGVIDDGSELFGPSTGKGYEELAELDSDGNGWIDEADDAFSQLGFWKFNEQGDPVVQSLTDIGLGALSLTRAETPYDLRNDEGELLAEVKSTGFALMEDGAVAVMQELNLRNFVEDKTNSITGNEQRLNPLNIFQDSTDERIQARVAETAVSIQGDVLYSLEANERALQRSSTTENSLTAATDVPGEEQSSNLTQMTEKDLIQSQILKKMRENLDLTNTQIRSSNPPTYTAPEAGDYRFLDQLPDAWQFDQTPEDGQLQQLKELVQALKDIHEQQQQALKRLGLYSEVGRFS